MPPVQTQIEQPNACRISMSNPFVKQTDNLLKQKWDRVFDVFFDLNKGGTIDWNDFEILFEKIKELRGEHSNEYTIAKDACLLVWKGLLHEAKGYPMEKEVDFTLEISREEWDKIWQNYNPKRQVPWQTEYIKFMFYLLDSSGDKYIDEGEFAEVLKMYGHSDNASIKAFRKLSVDEKGKSTGKVSYGDFVRLWNEYFTSTNPDAPGNYLFGLMA